MKKSGFPTFMFALVLLLAGGCQSVQSGLGVQSAALVPQTAGVPDQRERIGYSIGVNIGRDLQQQGLQGETDAVLRGIRDALSGSDLLLKEEEMEQARRVFLLERLHLRAKELGSPAEKNLAEGEAFLAENAKKEGVKTLPSGLQYRVLKEGDGESPDPDKNVKAHYVVRSLDGTELDSTRKRGKPVVFAVRGPIPAWSEALPLMKTGATWELYAPGYLAYGEKGAGGIVGPYQALIFEIELVATH